MPQVRVEVEGATFHAWLDGPAGAPCVVLAHSLGSSLAMWERQVAPFSREWRVLRYDARGHGGSAVTPGPYTIERLGCDVIGLLDGCGIERAHFCGLSMGGATGLWLAAHAPGRFGRFVLCDTAPWLGPPETMLGRAAMVRREGLATLVDATLERWFTPEFRRADPDAVAAIRTAFLATPPEGYAACCEALAGYDERDSPSRISAPVLVVAGTHDPSPPVATAREYAAHIAGAGFVELPAAHLTNIGAAEAFNAAVLRFLRAG